MRLLPLILLLLAACAPATASITQVTPLPADYIQPTADVGTGRAASDPLPLPPPSPR